MTERQLPTVVILMMKRCVCFLPLSLALCSLLPPVCNFLSPALLLGKFKLRKNPYFTLYLQLLFSILSYAICLCCFFGMCQGNKWRNRKMQQIIEQSFHRDLSCQVEEVHEVPQKMVENGVFLKFISVKCLFLSLRLLYSCSPEISLCDPFVPKLLFLIHHAFFLGDCLNSLRMHRK